MTYPIQPDHFNQQTTVFAAPGIGRVKTHNGTCWLEFGPLTLTVRPPEGHDLADKPDDYILWCELGRLQRQIEALWDARDDARQAADDAA